MNGEPREDEPLTASEERLLRLLASLEDDAPAGGLTTRVMRSVRWHSTLRGVVVALGTVAGAVAEGFAVLLGMRGERGGQRGDDDR